MLLQFNAPDWTVRWADARAPCNRLAFIGPELTAGHKRMRRSCKGQLGLALSAPKQDAQLLCRIEAV